MDSMQVNLPSTLVPFVAARVANHGYASVEEYIAALIRADQSEQQRFTALFANEKKSLANRTLAR